MSFKENLLQKLQIVEMSKKVEASMGPPGSGRRINRDLMRNLLVFGDFRYEKRRDLDLYFLDEAADGEEKILVLDNDLPIYTTHAEDVVLRKSPTVKEMISIKNAIKILSDSDVVVSKKEASLKTIRAMLIDRLDLAWKESDIDEIAKDGILSLERDYMEGVIEALFLFSDLLEYSLAPKAFTISNCIVIGTVMKKPAGEVLLGPVVIYSRMYNALKLVEGQTSNLDKSGIEFLHQVATGKEKASIEGLDVFENLKQRVISSV